MRSMIFALSLATAGVGSLSISAAGLAHSKVAPVPQLRSLKSANSLLDGQFDAEARSSSIIASLDEDVALFVVPVAGLARTKAEAIKKLGQAFGSGRSRVSVRPIRLGLSADREHGFSYGFMDIETAAKVRQGKYVAYWIRRPKGWRLAAFKWVPRPDGAVSTDRREDALPARFAVRGKNRAKLEQFRSSLDATERQFSAEAQAMGIGRAFRKYGSADAMNVGGEADFTFGNDAIAESQGGDTAKGSPVRWAPDGVLVSSSGDLGVTFGYLDRNGPTPPGRLARIPFFTIWRRASQNAEWKYVAE